MIAVKLYGQQPDGIPAAWPMEVQENVQSLPEGFTLLFADAAEYEAYRAEHQPAYDAWRMTHGARTAPESVTPRQIRWALNAAGLRGTVEGAIAGADQNTKDAWEFSNEVRRDNPLLNSLAADLRMSSEQLDDLFRLAASFE